MDTQTQTVAPPAALMKDFLNPGVQSVSGGEGVRPLATEVEILLEQAIHGDQRALQRVLIPYQRRLLGRIRRKLPIQLAAVVGPEDVLQEVYLDVFEGISGLSRPVERVFLRWLVTVTDHRLVDVVRRLQAAKRGGGWEQVHGSTLNSSVVPLLDLLHVDPQTPSQVYAQDEMEAALRVALASLKEEYREALRLRFLEGLNVADTARRMNRTEWSIHKLCSRALDQLRTIMGELSRYLTKV